MSSVRWSANPVDDSISLGRTNPTVYFNWKDGSQEDYACTAEQWKKLRAVFKAQGMVLEI